MKQQFQLQVEAPHFMDAFTNIRDIAKGSPELSPDHSTTGKKFLVSTGTCTEQLDSGTEGVRDGRIEEPVIGEEEEENGMGKELMTCVSHGSITVMGRRRVMEDTVMVVPAALSLGLYSYDFFAVYDGHGGSIVAELCRDRMHKLLSRAMDACKGGPEGGKGVTEVNWSKLMTTCFEKMDEEVGRSTGATEVDDRPHPSSERKVGCTAVVAVVGKEEIVVANCGDSRAVLCRGDDAVPLSRDHKVS